MKKVAYLVGLALIVALAWLAYDVLYDRGPPHRFVVVADKDIVSARLTLNGQTSEMQVDDRTARGECNVGDASGMIAVDFTDGTKARCTVGYVTNGEREPHRSDVREGACSVPASG